MKNEKEYDFNLLFVNNFDKWPFVDFTKRNPAPVLKSGCDVLKKLGLTHWLMCGVALGFHRQDDFIPYDTDIDIGVRLDHDDQKSCLDAMNNVWKEFIKAYFRPLRIMVYGSDKKYLMQASFIDQYKVPFDIFFFYDNIEKDHLVHYSDQGIIRAKTKHIDNIKNVKYKHGTYPIPTPQADFLEHYYGPGWKKPTGFKEKTWESEARGTAVELKDTPWRRGNWEWWRRWKHDRKAVNKKHEI